MSGPDSSPPTPTSDDEWAAALTRLEEVLAEERRAVAAFETDKLTALSAHKSALAARLRTALETLHAHSATSSGNTVDPDHLWRRRRLHMTLLRILAGAEANRLLLAEAAQALAEVRGMIRSTGTYDARARLGHYASGRVVKTL